jgi:hypothetical protein
MNEDEQAVATVEDDVQTLPEAEEAEQGTAVDEALEAGREDESAEDDSADEEAEVPEDPAFGYEFKLPSGEIQTFASAEFAVSSGRFQFADDWPTTNAPIEIRSPDGEGPPRAKFVGYSVESKKAGRITRKVLVLKFELDAAIAMVLPEPAPDPTLFDQPPKHVHEVTKEGGVFYVRCSAGDYMADAADEQEADTKGRIHVAEALKSERPLEPRIVESSPGRWTAACLACMWDQIQLPDEAAARAAWDEHVAEAHPDEPSDHELAEVIDAEEAGDES